MADIVWPNRLRELRKNKSTADGRPWSLEHVAKELNRSFSYLSKLERGQQRPDRSILEGLAAFYGVKPDAIEMPGARVEIDEPKVIGAWIRVLRKEALLSIETLARSLGVSASQLRLIEVGQRAFDVADDLNQRLAAWFEYESAEELKTAALTAQNSRQVKAELEGLHPQAFAPDSNNGRALTTRAPVAVPQHVRERMRGGEFALLVDRELPRHGVPEGAYLLVRPGWVPDDGLIEVDGELYDVREGVIVGGENLDTAKAAVTAIVLPLSNLT